MKIDLTYEYFLFEDLIDFHNRLFYIVLSLCLLTRQ